MPNRSPAEVSITYKVGDRVRIKHSGFGVGRIVEERGPLGPGGVPIYRVLVQVKPAPISIEVREDQLLPPPAASKTNGIGHGSME